MVNRVLIRNKKKKRLGSTLVLVHNVSQQYKEYKSDTGMKLERSRKYYNVRTSSVRSTKHLPRN